MRAASLEDSVRTCEGKFALLDDLINLKLAIEIATVADIQLVRDRIQALCSKHAQSTREDQERHESTLGDTSAQADDYFSMQFDNRLRLLATIEQSVSDERLSDQNTPLEAIMLDCIGRRGISNSQLMLSTRLGDATLAERQLAVHRLYTRGLIQPFAGMATNFGHDVTQMWCVAS